MTSVKAPARTSADYALEHGTAPAMLRIRAGLKIEPPTMNMKMQGIQAPDETVQQLLRR
jgi:hypothetical protein